MEIYVLYHDEYKHLSKDATNYAAGKWYITMMDAR